MNHPQFDVVVWSAYYTWDQLNRLSTVVDSRLATGQNRTDYSHDAATNLATVTYPNAVQSSQPSYDDLNRVTGLDATRSSYAYTLGLTGNRTSATESNGRTLNWSYDGIYRLTQETIGSDPHAKNGTASYGLDPVGNRLSQTASIPGLSSGNFTYDADDRLSTETYDNNGNALTSGGRTFAYDYANRLKSMNSGTVTIVYDGDGNRVAKTANGVTTHYLVDDLNPTGYAQVVDEVVGSVVSRTYTYGTQRISENQLIGGAWTPSFYGYDGGGTARFLTNAAASVTDTYDYDAWGNLVNSTGSTSNVYLYRAEQWDPDLGLYCQRARYFNPVSGRFLSRDTYEGNQNTPASFHKYIYASADPVDRSDPSGRLDFGEYATSLRYADEVGQIIAPRAIGPGLVAVGGIGASIGCVWNKAAGWLAIGELAVSGASVEGVVQTPCTVTAIEAESAPTPQPCDKNIGNCLPFREENKQPGDKEITYRTINPAPTCAAFIGERIFITQLGGRPTYNGFHTGLLRGGTTVIDNIYPAGIPLELWQGGAYTVPAECSPPGITILRDISFQEAVTEGIGKIDVK